MFHTKEEKKKLLPRKFTADASRQAGQILNVHVNSMELLIERMQEKLLNNGENYICAEYVLNSFVYSQSLIC